MTTPQTTPDPYASPQSNLQTAQTNETKTDLKSRLFSFKGRIPRRIYWAYSLISSLILYIPVVIAFVVLGEESPVAMIIMGLVYIPLVWISLALGIKRWHDRNKSGWWFCIGFIPIVGGLWSFIECGCLRGTMGDNNYGSDPT